MSLGIKWTPLINEKDAKCYHHEVTKEFPGLFADKLPAHKDRKLDPDAPKHRIEMKCDGGTWGGM